MMGVFREGALVRTLRPDESGVPFGPGTHECLRHVTTATLYRDRTLMRGPIEHDEAEPGLEQIVLTVSAERLAAHALLVGGRYVDEDHYVPMLG